MVIWKLSVTPKPNDNPLRYKVLCLKVYPVGSKKRSVSCSSPKTKSISLLTTTFLFLTYRQLGKDYDEEEIHSLIKEAENIEFELNLRLYELLENKSYLETAYNQVKEKADNLESDVAAKFLSYPIPKAIVEEWEKVK